MKRDHILRLIDEFEEAAMLRANEEAEGYDPERLRQARERLAQAKAKLIKAI